MQSCRWTPTFWTNMPSWEWSHVEDCQVTQAGYKECDHSEPIRVFVFPAFPVHHSFGLDWASSTSLPPPWKQHVPLILWYPQTRLQCHNPHNHNCWKDYRTLQLLRKHNSVTQEAHLCHASAQNEPKFKSLLQSSFPKFRFDAESSWFQKFLTGTQT